MEIKLFSVTLNRNAYTEKTKTFEVKKTAGGYVVTTPSELGSKIKRLKEKDILQIKTQIAENIHHYIGFYIWYFEPDEQKAKDMLVNKVIEIAHKQAETANKMLEHLNKLKIK